MGLTSITAGEASIVPNAVAHITTMLGDDAPRTWSAREAVESKILVGVRLEQLRWSKILESVSWIGNWQRGEVIIN